MVEENVQPGGSVEEKSGVPFSALRSVAPLNFQVTFFTAKEPSLVCYPGGTV